MEIKERKIPKMKFKTYIKILIDLETSFGKNNQKFESQICMKGEGYLIDKKEFDNIKNKLFYPLFKTLMNDDSKFKAKLNELYGNKEITFIPCEQKLFSSSKEFIDSLFKYNEYVIVNLLVWKIINNGKYSENERKIIFEIKDDKICLSFGNGVNIYFKFNSNIISSDNLLSRQNDEIKLSSKVQDHKSNKSSSVPKLLIIEFNQIKSSKLV